MKKTTLFLTLLIAFGISNSNNAAIVYNDIADETLASGGSIEIDFDGGGSEFTITDTGFGTIVPGVIFNSQDFHIATVSANEWDVMKGLTFGTSIDANVGFFDQGDASIDPMWGTTAFPNVDTYLGAQFKIGANTHYGWILVNWDGAGTFIVKSFAYNNVPNESINAGETSNSTSSVVRLENILVSVFPNPTSDLLMINLNEAINAEVTIYNLSGQNVKQLSMNGNTKVDVSNFTSGVYMLHVATDKGIFQNQIIIE